MISTAKTLFTLSLVLLVTTLLSCTQEQLAADKKLALETEDEKAIYAMGVNLARNIDHLPLSKSEREILQAGFADGLYKRQEKVDTVRYGRKVESLFERRRAAATEGEREAGEAFVAEVAALKGAVQSESGLVMQVLRPGDGPSPSATDRVRVHYHGKLRDGTVFDSSVNRGEPAVFAVNRVIRCWTEALQKMKVGEKSRVVCPSDIAYGDAGAPPLIKPGAALDFDVELLAILK